MHGRRILLVEDDFALNLNLSECFQEAGFRVESVYCAQAAFEILDRGWQIEALVTDVELGPGADGFAVGRQARATHPELPVIFISGTSALRHAAEGVEGSVFMAKPVEPGQVANMLRGMIRKEAA